MLSSAMLLGIGLSTGPHNTLMACVFAVAGCIPWFIYGLIEGYYTGYNDAVEKMYAQQKCKNS